jgi:hypothetical protein
MDGERRAVAAAPARMHGDGRSSAHLLQIARAVLRPFVELGHVVRLELLHRLATEHAREGWIGVQDRAVWSGSVDAVCGAVNERAVPGLRLSQPLFRVLPRRDVARDGLHASDRVPVLDKLDVLAQPDDVAVLLHRRKLEVRVRRAVLDLRAVQRPRTVVEIGPDERQEVAPDELVQRVLHHAARGGIRVGEHARAIAVIDEIFGAFHELPEPILACPQRTRRSLSLGHIAKIDNDRADRLFAQPVDGDRLDVAPRPVGMAHAIGGGQRLARLLQTGREGGTRSRQVVRVGEVEDRPAEPLVQRMAEHALR